ncbi:PREDICTED: eukaryotic translation initiation factor 2D [Tinamus guttatus]|uniref:eukaryotic translation initiation factor 2D n=1 Tax=Tinamus guttatus TaxID=94827 RepID=UPI00052F2412|nr:PREDICTED: eukaryotic translation initiation factor 2D [Tinamus guttatus]
MGISRKLRTDVAAAFPNLSTEQLTEFIPNKEELNVIKIHTHKGEAVTVYANNKNPVLFEIEKALYPTVYTLWAYPDLLPAFSTWPPVLQKLAGGADLMLPGVAVPSSGFPQVERGTLCAVTLLGNRAPVAVGVANMSSTEMLAAGMKGKGFAILHTYMDHLWELGDKSSPPTLAPSVEDEEEQEPVVNCTADPLQHVDIADLSLKEQDSCARLMGKEEPEDSRTPQEQMDELFNQCFFHALKCKVKKSDLPLLTSTFLRSHMFSCCPAGQQLDIKKSSYKKVRSLKGSILSSSEVRNIVINYVKANELVDETNKNFVKVNAILCDCLLDKSEQDEITNLKWDDLLSRCLERLQPLHQVTFFGQEPIVRKGNIEPISITIAQRSSNKKVTIIKNLELYGLDPQCVANILQQRVQASATITPVPGTKDRVQVQIQGNQIHHLAKMLLEEYQLPRKYIQGLEKAPKLGRKK